MQGHPRRAHVQEGCDHVDRAQDRRGTRQVDCKDRKVHRISTFTHRQRWVKHPANARTQLIIATRRQQRGHGKRGARNIHPIGQVVHPREGHVWRTDLQRHEVVAKAAKQRRNNHKEHHQDAVRGNSGVPEVAVRGAFACGVCDKAHPLHAHVLHAGFHQLHPHIHGEDHRDKAD